jgi:hypothetical protein
MSTTTERILIAIFLIVAVILAMRDANATRATSRSHEPARPVERVVSHVPPPPTWAGRNEYTCVHTSPGTTTADRSGYRIEDSETNPSKS